jgi:hypothetical protein
MSDRRIELRPDHEGFLDDVVVLDVKMFRLERMDTNSWWACCYLDGFDERVDFWFHANRKDGLTARCTDVPSDASLCETQHGFMDLPADDLRRKQ